MSEFKPFNFEKIGSFGRFVTGNSFPIEYVMVNLNSSQLKKLTFARDIRPDKIDFDLLIQRDIDEDRVKDKIEPYLYQKGSEKEMSTRAAFFPPLLAAIIPTDNNKMLEHYPDEKGYIEGDYLIREWANLFRIKYFKEENESAYKVDTYVEDELVKVGIDISTVNLELYLSEGAEAGARLVVIDGQHRLFALNELYKNDHKLIENLLMPVCILFPPYSTVKREQTNGSKLPTVPEVFRHLFVDVNSTMELVGGHFNILLSDETIPNLTCRRFCKSVLDDNTLLQEGLSVIEWNTKKAKDKTFIKREYSLTSIGIIEEALRDNFNTSTSIKYLLVTPSKEQELYPENGDPADYPNPINYNDFTLSQKETIEYLIDKNIVPCLKEIFFNSDEYKKAYNIYIEQITDLKKVANDKDNKDNIYASRVLDLLINYIPIPDTKSMDPARAILETFKSNIKEKREASVSNLIDKNVFQWAIFIVLSKVFLILRDQNILPIEATKGIVTLLNKSMKDKGKCFAIDMEYMQHSVYSGYKIKPLKETRKALANLLLAHLGNKLILESFCISVGIKPENLEQVKKKLLDVGFKAASDFIQQYSTERKKFFKLNYKVDFSLDKDQREEITVAEETYKLQSKQVREGLITKDKVLPDFDNLVGKYSIADVSKASAKLKHSLGYDVDILSTENGTTDDSEG